MASQSNQGNRRQLGKCQIYCISTKQKKLVVTSSESSIMGNKQIKQHLETAQKTGILKISQQRLQDLPPQMHGYPNVLKTLDLSQNRFETIPEHIGKFTLIKHFNMSGNHITEVPNVLGELLKLEVLLLNDNLIVQISPTLSNCQNLKTVNLSHNQITEFPVMLCGLKHLDGLDLSRNKITVVPPEVGTLRVTELNLNQNQISVLAEEVADCPKLKTLRLEENCLQASAFTPRILRESKISNLAVDGNLFNSRQFNQLDGYESYMERYTEVRKKMY